MSLRPPGAVELGREEAARLAREELSRGEYRGAQPGLLRRAVEWVQERLGDLLDRAAGAAPGGWAGLLTVAALVVVAVVVVRARVGPLAREHRARALFTGSTLTAEQHRAAADAHAGSGRWNEAVRERLRALVRDLQERDIVAAGPGITADEAADQAGSALPGLGGELRAAAALFDAVAYGARLATSQQDAGLRRLDEQVRAARPAQVRAARPAQVP